MTHMMKNSVENNYKRKIEHNRTAVIFGNRLSNLNTKYFGFNDKS